MTKSINQKPLIRVAKTGAKRVIGCGWFERADGGILFIQELGEVGSQATAEELAMEVFIRLHRAAGRWRPEAKLSTYLIHIARNLVLNEWRRRGRKPTTALEFAAEPGDVSQGSVRRVAELDEAFQRAILQLPPEQRTAILLVVQQELPYEEIAVIMEAPVSSVKTWIHRARARLRELLKDFYAQE